MVLAALMTVGVIVAIGGMTVRISTDGEGVEGTFTVVIVATTTAVEVEVGSTKGALFVNGITVNMAAEGVRRIALGELSDGTAISGMARPTLR